MKKTKTFLVIAIIVFVFGFLVTFGILDLSFHYVYKSGDFFYVGDEGVANMYISLEAKNTLIAGEHYPINLKMRLISFSDKTKKVLESQNFILKLEGARRYENISYGSIPASFYLSDFNYDQNKKEYALEKKIFYRAPGNYNLFYLDNKKSEFFNVRIAPPEILFQIKTNRILIGLTIIIISLTLVTIFHPRNR